jgi:hypothetical protein
MHTCTHAQDELFDKQAHELGDTLFQHNGHGRGGGASGGGGAAVDDAGGRTAAQRLEQRLAKLRSDPHSQVYTRCYMNMVLEHGDMNMVH